MEKIERDAYMWSDLLSSENRVVAEKHAVTLRALLYVESGLEIARVLDALKISRATWHRRVQDLKHWQSANSAATRQMLFRSTDSQ
jgi:hypothetical protein